MSRSIANCFLPVTMSRASMRLTGLPITSNDEDFFRSTFTCLVVLLAALAASSA